MWIRMLFLQSFTSNFLLSFKIHSLQSTKLSLLMRNNILVDIYWLEAKVRLAGELPPKFVTYMRGCGKENHSRKRRAKELQVSCHKCDWTNGNRRCCKSLGMVSNNKENNIQFIRDGLNKESMYDILWALETHPIDTYREQFFNYWLLFQKERASHILKNLTIKDLVCQFIRKLGGKPIFDVQRAFKLFLTIKPEEDMSHNHNYHYISFCFTVLLSFALLLLTV